MTLRHLCLLTCFTSLNLYAFCQSYNEVIESAACPSQPDSIQNWHLEVSEICVDTSFITKSMFKINDHDYNYSRTYLCARKILSKSGNYVDSVDFMLEYGNVDQNKLANGHWAYCWAGSTAWLEGEVVNDHKIDNWSTVLCENRFIIYEWNTEKTITHLKYNYCVQE